MLLSPTWSKVMRKIFSMKVVRQDNPVLPSPAAFTLFIPHIEDYMFYNICYRLIGRLETEDDFGPSLK